MRVSVVQVDGKMPNLALMKLAGWHQQRGDEVVRGLDGSADKAYISVIWPQNLPRALSASKMFTCPVEIGGSGISYAVTLPDEIEHTMPAYDLWGADTAMGFTSRGCIRKCGFCIVPEKEGRIRQHSPLAEFVRDDHKKVILFDNNILAAPNLIDTMTELHERRLKVSFNQGLDIRLVDEEKATLLAKTWYYNWHFNSRQLYFAFDNVWDEKVVRKGIPILEAAGIRPEHLMIYMLVGFNTTFEEDMQRYSILWEEHRVEPYVMIYNNIKEPTLRAFARWVNRRVHKHVSWVDYEYGAKKAGKVVV